MKGAIELGDDPKDVKYIRDIKSKLRDLDDIADMLTEQKQCLVEFRNEMSKISSRLNQPSIDTGIIEDYLRSAQLPLADSFRKRQAIKILSCFNTGRDELSVGVRVMIEAFFKDIGFQSPTKNVPGYTPLYQSLPLPFDRSVFDKDAGTALALQFSTLRLAN